MNESHANTGSVVVQPASNASVDTSKSSTVATGASSLSLNTTASAKATFNKAKRGGRTSGRKRSRKDINYNDKAGDKPLEMILRAYQNHRPAPKRAKALVNDSGDDGIDNVMV